MTHVAGVSWCPQWRHLLRANEDICFGWRYPLLHWGQWASQQDKTGIQEHQTRNAAVHLAEWRSGHLSSQGFCWIPKEEKLGAEGTEETISPYTKTVSGEGPIWTQCVVYQLQHGCTQVPPFKTQWFLFHPNDSQANVNFSDVTCPDALGHYFSTLYTGNWQLVSFQYITLCTFLLYRNLSFQDHVIYHQIIILAEHKVKETYRRQ